MACSGINRFSRVLLAGAVFLTVSGGCDIRDDLLNIHKQVDEIIADDEKLAQQIAVLTETVGALQAITDVLQGGYYIKSVTPFKDEDGRTGNICSFTNGTEIRIYDGVDGSDGYTPEIGVEMGEDGNYYWTLDGELILDSNGNPIRVSSSRKDGETIEDDTNMTPQFTIRNGYWFISYDYGNTWIQLGLATGRDGRDGEDGVENIITIDQTSEDYVSFVLKNGTTLSIPYYKEIRISFDMEDFEAPIAGRETISVSYKLSASDSGTYVSVSSDGFYSAVSKQTSELEGYILITCPRAFVDGYVNVIVYSRSGVSDLKVIRFYEKSMTFSNGLEFDVPREGGKITVPFESNFEYTIEPDKACSDWLAVDKTKGGLSISGEILLSASENKGIARSGIVNIYSKNGVAPFASIIVDQESAYCKADNGSYVISYEGGTILSNLTTSYGVTMSLPVDSWIRGEVIKKDKPDEYYLAFTVDPNKKMDSRTVVIDVHSGDGSIPLTKITIVQRGRNVDLEYSMIFIVRPNYSNDFTAYLPIDIQYRGSDYPFDCFIDWGDGSPGQHFTYNDKLWELPKGDRAIHHHYEGLEIGREFEVVVSGQVSSLNSDAIPDAYKSSISEVKQWGKTGLKLMNNAFRGCTGLETLHPDETGAFSDVSSFYGAFSECPRLKTISEHLFDYAKNAENFEWLFYECSSLVNLPENLFASCQNATTFGWAFYDCTSLASIPENLFSGCGNVESFYATFCNCRSIKAIPEKLFWNCPKVKLFPEVFNNCFNIENIPEQLFSKNTKAQDFSYSFQSVYGISSIPAHLFDNCSETHTVNGTFRNCNNIKSIPISLFDNLRNVVDFQCTFTDCYQIEGESPYSIIDGIKVHLYERADYPDYFVTPIRYSYCFCNCWRLEDWETIPSIWKYN